MFNLARGLNYILNNYPLRIYYASGNELTLGLNNNLGYCDETLMFTCDMLKLDDL